MTVLLRPALDAPEAREGAVSPGLIADLRVTGADAVREILGFRARTLLRHVSAATGGHPDAIHDLRVATRRLRSALRTLRALVPRRTRTLRRRLRALARRLGTVRDLDVLLEGLPAAAAAAHAGTDPGVATWRLGLERTRREALTHVHGWLSGDAGRRLRDRLRAIGAGRIRGRVPRPARGPIGPRAADLVEAPLETALRAGRGIRAASPPEDLHRLRILVKRARYALEPFVTVGGAPLAALIARAVSLQDLLGAHQDAVVAAARLRHVTGAGPRALVEVYRRRAAVLHRGFAAAWRALDRPASIARALAPLRPPTGGDA